MTRPACAGLLAAALVLLPVPTARADDMAALAGQWSLSEVSGVPRYATRSMNGATFAIWCPHTARPVVEVIISGKPPPPNQLVRIVVDRSMIKLRSDKLGYIRGDCRLCKDQMTWLWNKLRAGSFLQIQLDDGRYSGFSMRGAAALMGADICSPG